MCSVQYIGVKVKGFTFFFFSSYTLTSDGNSSSFQGAEPLGSAHQEEPAPFGSFIVQPNRLYP